MHFLLRLSLGISLCVIWSDFGQDCGHCRIVLEPNRKLQVSEFFWLFLNSFSGEIGLWKFIWVKIPGKGSSLGYFVGFSKNRFSGLRFCTDSVKKKASYHLESDTTLGRVQLKSKAGTTWRSCAALS